MIFITGHHNTGKSTIAKWLVPLGFTHIETGEIVRKNYTDTNLGEDFYAWVSKKNKENENYLDDLIVGNIRNILNENNSVKLVITGNRQIEGIDYIRKNIDKPSLIFFLYTHEEELFRRQLERLDRKIPDLTFDIFKNKYLAYDEIMGVSAIKEKADYIFENSRDNSGIKEQILEILKVKLYLKEHHELTK